MRTIGALARRDPEPMSSTAAVRRPLTERRSRTALRVEAFSFSAIRARPAVLDTRNDFLEAVRPPAVSRNLPLQPREQRTVTRTTEPLSLARRVGRLTGHAGL